MSTTIMTKTKVNNQSQIHITEMKATPVEDCIKIAQGMFTQYDCMTSASVIDTNGNEVFLANK